jgi:hypothetical protein
MSDAVIVAIAAFFWEISAGSAVVVAADVDKQPDLPDTPLMVRLKTWTRYIQVAQVGTCFANAVVIFNLAAQDKYTDTFTCCDDSNHYRNTSIVPLAMWFSVAVELVRLVGLQLRTRWWVALATAVSMAGLIMQIAAISVFQTWFLFLAVFSAGLACISVLMMTLIVAAQQDARRVRHEVSVLTDVVVTFVAPPPSPTMQPAIAFTQQQPPSNTLAVPQNAPPHQTDSLLNRPTS